MKEGILMRGLAVVCLLVAWMGCNYTDGACYPRGQGGTDTAAGAGGGDVVAVGSGPGGFGNVPPRPQDFNDPPNCNTTARNAVCQAHWPAGAIACKKQNVTGPCTTPFQVLAESLEQAAKLCAEVEATSCDGCAWETSAQDQTYVCNGKVSCVVGDKSVTCEYSGTKVKAASHSDAVSKLVDKCGSKHGSDHCASVDLACE